MNSTVKRKACRCGGNKLENGYFTVEAACILPAALWMILFIVCMMFYQYDRCLLEQDIGILALRGAVDPENDVQKVSDGIRRQADALYAGKFVAMGRVNTLIKVNGGGVTVEGEGSIQFPPIYNWNFKASFTNKRLDPVSFIRACRKLRREAS